MPEFAEHVQRTATPDTQTKNEHTAATRIESGTRLHTYADSAVAILDSDVALRLGPGSSVLIQERAREAFTTRFLHPYWARKA